MRPLTSRKSSFRIVQACKLNEQRINGKCAKKPSVSILCKKGYKLVGKRCVRIRTLTQKCKRGEKLKRGNCVKTKPARARTLIAPKRMLHKKHVKRTLRKAPRINRKATVNRALRVPARKLRRRK